jgi:hypothetical protein
MYLHTHSQLLAAARRATGSALLAGVLALVACAPLTEQAPGAAEPPAGGPPTEAPSTALTAAPPVTVAAPAPAAPLPLLPFDDAVVSAANNLLSKAELPPDGTWNLVIDPLIDGVTGAQTQATRAMGARIVKIIKDGYPRYAVQPFTAASVKTAPLLLVGTFTGVNAERKTEGKREAFRICLALADLKTGKLVSKGLAFATPEGVDSRPLPLERDAPAWLEDASTTGYIRTCQGTRPGDPIHPAYVDKVLTSAVIAEANAAYAAGKLADARKLFETARTSPGGEQLRTYTGLYLTNWKLGNRTAAAEAFGKIVDQGLDAKRLGTKFLFRPGTPALWADPKAGPPAHPMWLAEIARHTAERQSCLEVVGNSSASGPEPLNERLSLLRAETVAQELVRLAPQLKARLIANGVGSRNTLIGTGRDDTTDALDRRVEFKVVGC